MNWTGRTGEWCWPTCPLPLRHYHTSPVLLKRKFPDPFTTSLFLKNPLPSPETIVSPRLWVYSLFLLPGASFLLILSIHALHLGPIIYPLEPRPPIPSDRPDATLPRGLVSSAFHPFPGPISHHCSHNGLWFHCSWGKVWVFVLIFKNKYQKSLPRWL